MNPAAPDYEPTDLLAQEERRAEELRDADLDTANARVDLQSVMDTLPGRRFVHRLLSWARVFASTYSDHAGRMARNEGRREYGTILLRQLVEHCPASYRLMMEEAAHVG